MVFKRHVEVGRTVLINYGPDYGKLAVIVDILDENRALIDGAPFGVRRQVLNFRRMALTDIKIKLGKGARTATLNKKLEEEKVAEQWAKTAWAQKLEKKKKRAALTDFGRFELMIAKKTKNQAIRQKFNELKKMI